LLTVFKYLTDDVQMRSLGYSVLAVSALLIVQCAQLAAQPGCIVGDRFPRNVRIYDAGNTCGCASTAPDVLLHLLHSHTPTLKLTNNNANGNCVSEVDGTLSLYYDGTKLSTLESQFDLSLVSGFTANDLILSTRNDDASIIFGTTPASTTTDIERMRILPIGHVGIAAANPKELLQIGARMTFHVGTENDYLGYNVYRDGSNDKLIVGTSSPNQGYAVKYGMTKPGVIEIGAGSTSSGAAGETVDWYEGGSAFGPFAGLTIKQYSGKGCASFGRYWPDQYARVFIKSFSGSSSSALSIVSSSDAELFRVRENGNTGVGQSDPKELLQIGDLMTFHNGGSKFIGFNTYYDAVAGYTKSFAVRASVTMGIGDATSNPDVFTIAIDKNTSVGRVFDPAGTFGSFKGIAIKTNGDLGIGEGDPDSRLEINGRGNTSSTTALKINNSSSTTLAVLRDDGAMGIGTTSPSARLHVKGSGATASTNSLVITNSTPTDVLRVRDDGKVLIGAQTITSGAHTDFKLSVDGKIIARSLVATETGWADDVFEKDYDLMDLNTLASYIEANGHLPGVPTTDEVNQDGLNVSSAIVTLLRKVEELTLHIIDLNKRNVSLEQDIQSLSTSNTSKK